MGRGASPLPFQEICVKRKWTVLAVAGMLIIGIAVLLYPAISSAVNRQHGSFAIQQMQQQLDNMDSEQMEAALAEAREYNDQLIMMQHRMRANMSRS